MEEGPAEELKDIANLLHEAARELRSTKKLTKLARQTKRLAAKYDALAEKARSHERTTRGAP